MIDKDLCDFLVSLENYQIEEENNDSNYNSPVNFDFQKEKEF